MNMYQFVHVHTYTYITYSRIPIYYVSLCHRLSHRVRLHIARTSSHFHILHILAADAPLNCAYEGACS